MAAQKMHSAKKKRMINNVIVHVSLAVLAAIWVFPIVWVILTSFRAEKGSYVSTFFPKEFTLDNYIRLFTDTSILNFPKMFMNTLIIAVFSCILATFYTLAVSYCLSRLKFKLRKPYMNMAMILGLFPGFMSMIAVYFILKAIGLTEGSLIRVALILCYSGGNLRRMYEMAGISEDHIAAWQTNHCIYGAHCIHGAVARLYLCKGNLPCQF